LNHRFVVTDAAFWAERLGCSEAAAAQETDLIGQQWPDAFARNSEEGIYRLASAVVSFRRHGRPSGDTVSDIGGIALLTTSLAAAVAEYVSHLTNTWAQALQEAEDTIADRR
jgi:hypothetical protein